MKKPTKENLLKAAKYITEAIVIAIAIAFGLSSCGTTRASISKPAEGTTTTITITTNNPISTTTTPNINLK